MIGGIGRDGWCLAPCRRSWASVGPDSCVNGDCIIAVDDLELDGCDPGDVTFVEGVLDCSSANLDEPSLKLELKLDDDIPESSSALHEDKSRLPASLCIDRRGGRIELRLLRIMLTRRPGAVDFETESMPCCCL